MPAIVTLKAIAAAHAGGRIAEARELCAQLLAESPQDGDAWMWWGLVAMAELRWADAASAFGKALEARLEPWSLANLGLCCFKLGHAEHAERSLRDATELKPDLYLAWIGLATALHGLRRFDDALAALGRAEALPGRDAQIDLRRGCTLVELGRFDEAQAAFGRASAASGATASPRLVRFDRDMYSAITAPRPRLREPRTLLQPNAPQQIERVIVISCDPLYARKYGGPFLRSYGEHARAGELLHLHIIDPDPEIAADMERIARAAGVAALAITAEDSPYPAAAADRRRTYYACARFLHLPCWLERYRRPVLVLDIDFIVERCFDAVFGSGAEKDLSLNARHPIEAPWLDVIANLIVARPTASAHRFLEAVANYALDFLERESQAWTIDQAALFCVLRMFERFDTPPAVEWLPQAHQSGLFHLGHLYDHRLDDPRFRRYTSQP